MTPVVDKRMLDFLTQGLKSILADECVAQGEALGMSKGMVEGRSQSLLLILSARGLAVDALMHERIVECEDAELLDRWIRRAATCAAAQDIFADLEAPLAPLAPRLTDREAPLAPRLNDREAPLAPRSTDREAPTAALPA